MRGIILRGPEGPEVPDEDALAAVRSVPHPRGHCCDDCLKARDDENNRQAWAVAQGRETS